MGPCLVRPTLLMGVLLVFDSVLRLQYYEVVQRRNITFDVM